MSNGNGTHSHEDPGGIEAIMAGDMDREGPLELRDVLDFPDIDIGKQVVPLKYRLQPYSNKAVALCRMQEPSQKEIDEAAAAGKDAPLPKAVPVCRHPVVILSKAIDVHSDAVRYRLAWQERERGKWHTAWVPALALRQSKTLIETLGAYGIAASNSNASAMLRWFEALEHANTDDIPTIKTTGQCGWHGDAFVLGKRTVGNGPTFVGDDVGDDRRAEAITARGTLQGWLTAWNLVKRHPWVRLTAYGSQASLLLEPVGLDAFALDIAHKTSVGKTHLKRFIASFLAQPDRQPGAPYGISWEATAVALERMGAMLNSLPFVVDETKRAQMRGTESAVPGTVYRYTNGEGKARGTVKGTQVMRVWRGVMVSTGEKPIQEFSTDGGVTGRVVPVWGKPFGEPSQEGVEMLEGAGGLQETLEDHHGHITPRFAEYLVANLHDKEKWKARVRELRTELRTELGELHPEPGIASRLYGFFATIELTGELLHAAVPELGEYMSPVRELGRELGSGAKHADRAAQALSLVWGMVAQNINKFVGDGREVERGELLGKYSSDDEVVSIIPDVLASWLDRAGYDGKAMIRQMEERGWFRKTMDKTHPYKPKVATVSGHRPRCYQLWAWTSDSLIPPPAPPEPMKQGTLYPEPPSSAAPF